MSFPLFGIGWKIQGMENPGEKFLSQAHQFFPPKSGGKSREENWAECSFTRMPSADPFHSRLSPTPLITFVQITYHLFSSSSLYLPSTPSTVPGSLLSFFFFFSFNVIYCFLSSFSCWFFGLHYNNKNNNINLYIWCGKFYII